MLAITNRQSVEAGDGSACLNISSWLASVFKRKCFLVNTVCTIFALDSHAEMAIRNNEVD
jgi:hypothetical protein